MFNLLVTGEVTDVIAGTGHFVGVDGGLGGEPGDETAGGISATAFGYALLEELQILLLVEVEGRTAPVAFGVGGFFLHGED